MAVTYNKINWDEETPITVANLDRIDTGIDEVVTQSNSNEGRITTNEDDISNIEDGTTKVSSASQADNALALQNESLEVVTEGSVVIDSNEEATIELLSGAEHRKYFFSVYSTMYIICQGYNETGNYATINRKAQTGESDFLKIVNRRGTSDDAQYKVWVLR